MRIDHTRIQNNFKTQKHFVPKANANGFFFFFLIYQLKKRNAWDTHFCTTLATTRYMVSCD